MKKKKDNVNQGALGLESWPLAGDGFDDRWNSTFAISQGDVGRTGHELPRNAVERRRTCVWASRACSIAWKSDAFMSVMLSCASKSSAWSRSAATSWTTMGS